MKILLSLILALVWSAVYHNGLHPIFENSSIAYSIGAFPAAIISTLFYIIGFVPLFLTIKNRKKNLEEKKMRDKKKTRYHFFIDGIIDMWSKKNGSFRPISINEIFDDYRKNNCKDINYFVSNNDVDPNLKTKVDIFDYFKKYRTDDLFFLGLRRISIVNNNIYYLEVESNNMDENVTQEDLKNENNADLQDTQSGNNNSNQKSLELDDGLDIKEAKRLLSKHYKIPIKDIEIHLKG